MWNVSEFGATSDGQKVQRFTWTAGNKIEVSVIDYGATITSIRTPDNAGLMGDIVAGFDTIADYEAGQCYFGATVGRVANRIARGQFKLDGQEYQLPINNKPNHLHGGIKGFDKKCWKSSVDGGRLRMTYTSADGEEGYPGQLDVCVCFELQGDDSLVIDYVAKTSRPTIVNLTNHSYFNLAGHKCANINEHTLQINADKFTPKDEDGIPTGELRTVDGTLFDLRKPVRLGDVMDRIPGGCAYDHNFCIVGDSNKKLAARVEDGSSGRTLHVYTTQPGVQLYTAHYVDCSGKGGAKYTQYSSLCLETQNYLDAVNQPSFPSCVLRPGESYHETAWYVFGLNQSAQRSQ